MARPGDPAAPGRLVDVLDVTKYPAALVDYSPLSSTRLTGEPLVLPGVPPAEYATGTRSFLFLFDNSALGPFVDDTDTDAVAKQLRDVSALRARLQDDVTRGRSAARRSGWATDGPLALLDLSTP